MNEFQAIVTLGLGTVLAVILVVWIIKWLVPSMLRKFSEEMQAEREMHMASVREVVASMREIRDEVRMMRGK